MWIDKFNIDYISLGFLFTPILFCLNNNNDIKRTNTIVQTRALGKTNKHSNQNSVIVCIIKTKLYGSEWTLSNVVSILFRQKNSFWMTF